MFCHIFSPFPIQTFSNIITSVGSQYVRNRPTNPVTFSTAIFSIALNVSDFIFFYDLLILLFFHARYKRIKIQTWRCSIDNIVH